MSLPEIKYAPFGASQQGDMVPQRSEENEKLLPQDQYAPWLAGIFEIKGRMDFFIKNDKRSGLLRQYAYPRLRLTDTQETTAFLVNVFGGRDRCLNEKNNSWIWELSNETVPEITVKMEHYSPSHIYDIEMFQKWKESKTVEAALSVAKEHREKRKIPQMQRVSLESYQTLIEDKMFLNAVVYALARLEGVRDDGHFIAMWMQCSEKPELLQAIKQKYLGTILKREQEGEEGIIHGRKFTRKLDQYKLRLGYEDGSALLQDVRDYYPLDDALANKPTS